MNKLYKTTATCERCNKKFGTDCQNAKVCIECTWERNRERKEEKLLLKKGKKHLNT